MDQIPRRLSDFQEFVVPDQVVLDAWEKEDAYGSGGEKSRPWGDDEVVLIRQVRVLVAVSDGGAGRERFCRGAVQVVAEWS